jgi:hypothetical protein
VSIIDDDDGVRWGSSFALHNAETPPRTFGPTWFEVVDFRRSLALTRTIVCPDGEVPWVLVHVVLRLDRSARAPRTLRHVEQWQLRPRFLNLLEPPALRRTRAEAGVTYDVAMTKTGLVAEERFAAPTDPGAAGAAAPFLIAARDARPRAARRDGRRGDGRLDGGPHPVLEITTSVRSVRARAARAVVSLRSAGRDASVAGAVPSRALAAPLWRACRAPGRPWPRSGAGDPVARGGVDRRLPSTACSAALALRRRNLFHGFRAARPAQPPGSCTEPERRCRFAEHVRAQRARPPRDAHGATHQPAFRPSDATQGRRLAAEHAAGPATVAFDEPLAYHPTYDTLAVPLREHLRRQFRFFVDEVGRGERGHVRILNADWNDTAIADSGVDRAVMVEQGSSVLNSAMASWVLAVFAGLASRLGDTALATEATAQADELRALVAQAWNGRWFHRAYAPGVAPVGDADCWLEVQPWAILCGAADASQAASLIALIDQGHRAGSPVGARLRWPAPPDRVAAGTWGDATLGGSWYAIDMTLVWAAARVAPDVAWDAWRRMTLGAHTAAYPAIWEGTLSGPDSWNAPESTRPGRTWSAAPAFAMQAFPVNNSHSHAQPLFAYLRLLGIEPTSSGTLAVGAGAEFRSRVLRLARSGHGSLRTRGVVTVETTHGTVQGRSDRVRW